MSNSQQLGDVVDIKLGLAFKTAIKDIGENGSCYLIQTKNISSDSFFKQGELVRVAPEVSTLNHHLSPGDVLLRLRGPIFSAMVFEHEWDLPCIVTNQTAVIRCNLELISPYYLQWYLNSSFGQRYFQVVSEGTNINKITSKIISNMELELPTFEDQKLIENIHKNWSAQKKVHMQLIDSGDFYFNRICTQIQEKMDK